MHLITGATGLGKTPLAIDLARISGAPIIVADRIQCFVDMATTVARGPVRPARYFLAERRVRDGDLPADEALDALVRKLRELTEHHPFVIVEGGSVSLIQRFAELLPELPYRVTVRLLRCGDDYPARLARRARGMLTARGASMFDELATAWSCTEQRALVESILGFDVILKWCRAHSVEPGTLTGTEIPEDALGELVSAVTACHAEYGFMQDRLFSKIFEAEGTAYDLVR